MTKVELDLILNLDMYLFFEKNIRGDVSYILTKYIMNLDKNNSYGYAMSKSFPTVGFKWFCPAKFNLDKNDDNSSRGCVLQVYVEFPKLLHKLHNDYLLVQDKLEIKQKILSDNQLKTVGDYIISIGNVDKLVN